MGGELINTKELMSNRRSIRYYNSKAITRQQIIDLVEAANWAPSACNIQGWRFIIINDRKLLDNIVRKGAASFLREAKCSILVVYDNRTENIEYADHIQSAAAAIQNMLLMAHNLGIGACWVCNLPPKKYLRKMLQIPNCYEPIGLVSIGSYDEEPVKRIRKHSVDEIISYNRFNFIYDNDFMDNLKLLCKRLARKIYYLIPPNKLSRRIAQKYEKKFD